MKKTERTRRKFLKSLGLGMASAVTSSCLSISRNLRGRQSFTFAQICDTQLGMGGYEHDVEMFKKAVTHINELNPDFVAICGDLVNNANEKSFADFNRIKSGFKVPSYCVPGNHDVGKEPTRKSLQYYRRTVGDDYYSFEHKGYLFVFVNTQLWKAPVDGESDRHDAWLENTLESAAAKNTPVFIVGHYPLFLNQPDEREEYMNIPPAKRRELISLFERGGVVAVLGGHTHRLIINEYRGIQFVNGETTSKNFDKRPLGFRLWHVEGERPFRHDFIPLADF